MSKLAIFVEGFTEVLFVEKLIEGIAGRHNVRIEHREIRGGGKDSGSRRTMGVIRAAREAAGEKYFVLIFDCGGDRLVKTRIMEEHENLTRADYAAIIGLRDVRPDFTHADIPKLEENLPRYLKTKLIPVHFVLAVMELEAWFLAEHTHFAKIDPAITVPAIKDALGFDPENDDMQLRPAPADDLAKCYTLGGKAYLKHNALETVNALSYEDLYMVHAAKIPQLQRLVQHIESFLAT
jgi:hypothetical protein